MLIGPAWEVLESVAEPVLLLLAGTRRRAITTALLALMGAVVCGVIYLERAALYERTITGMLALETTPAPQKFKGLEAFILHLLDYRAGTGQLVTTLREREINADFRASVDQLTQGIGAALDTVDSCLAQTTASSTGPEAKKEPGTRPPSTQPKLKEDPCKAVKEIAFLYAKRGTSKSSVTDVITDNTYKKTQKGFLFIPKPILRMTAEGRRRADKADSTSDKWANAMVHGDEQLMRDAIVSAAAVDSLDALSNTALTPTTTAGNVQASSPVDGQVPLQVYLVTSTGTTRIFSFRNKEKLENYYATQFSPTTFFPSRPYYAAAIEATQRFAVTGPYLDLAGNGLVVTFSKAIIKGDFTAVLCIDFSLLSKDLIQERLEQGLREFNGLSYVARFNFLSTVPKPSVEVVEQPTDPGKSALVSRWKEKFMAQDRSDVFGQILAISDGTTIFGSVPIHSETQLSPISGDFLLFKIDLVDFRRWTTTIGGAAAFLVGLIVSILVYRLALESRNQRSYQEALKRVADMMDHAPVPFVKLDRRDEIAYANRAFLDLVRFDDVDAIKQRHKTFEKLVHEKSRPLYKKVNAARTAGKNVPPYTVLMNTASNQPIRVRLHAASVPSEIIGKLPDTFGIAILVDDQDHPVAGAVAAGWPSTVAAGVVTAPAPAGADSKDAGVALVLSPAVRRYQVFISSTSGDLRRERKAIAEAIHKLDHISVHMEHFNASDSASWDVVEKELNQTDYCIVILAGRYGSVDPSTGISWTERELLFANQKRLPVLTFIRARNAILAADSDVGENAQRLTQLIAIAQKARYCAEWREVDDLCNAVTTALAVQIRKDELSGKPRPGWRRLDQAQT